MNNSERFKYFAGTEEVRKELRIKSVVSALSNLAAGSIDFLARLVGTAILARIVIPEQWGLVSIVLAVTALAEEFRDLGLSSATVQSREISHEQVTNLFWVNTLGGLALALIICALSPILSSFYNDQRLILITIAISSNFFWAGLTVQHSALLRRKMKLPQLSIINLSANILSTVIAVVLALNKFGYWALVWREVSRNVFILVGYYIACPWIPSLPYRNCDIRKLLFFGRDLALTGVLGAIVTSLDRLIIGKLFGPSSVALYRQAQQLIMTPVNSLLSPILSVTEPGLCALQSDRERFRRYYEKILLIVSLISMPIGFFIAVYSKEITRLVLGEKWIDASLFLLIFGVTASIRSSVGTSGIVLISSGQSKMYFKLAILHNVVLFIFMFIGVRWGPVGIACVDGARSITLMLPTLYLSFKNTPVTMIGFFSTIRRPFIASFTMVLSLSFLRFTFPIGNILLSLIFGCMVALIIYFGTLIIMPAGRADLKDILKDALSPLRKLKTSIN